MVLSFENAVTGSLEQREIGLSDRNHSMSLWEWPSEMGYDGINNQAAIIRGRRGQGRADSKMQLQEASCITSQRCWEKLRREQ
jgi:hypothetical protein